MYIRSCLVNSITDFIGSFPATWYRWGGLRKCALLLRSHSSHLCLIRATYCTIAAHQNTVGSNRFTSAGGCTTEEQMERISGDGSTLSHALLFKLARGAVLLDWRKRPFYLLSNRHKPFMERYKDLINACLQLNNQWGWKFLFKKWKCFDHPGERSTNYLRTSFNS